MNGRLELNYAPDELDLLLGIDLTDPANQLARYLVEQDSDYLRALRQARIDAGLSQADVAARMGVAAAAVHALEQMDSDPRLSTLRRYALAIDAQVSHRVA